MSETKLLNGAEILLESLRKENVKHIFGYPGGATLKFYEALYDCDFLEHILVRHEQGAVHMAEGYAKSTGKVGVVVVTSGPGATNTVTGIADAYMDSVPIVVFTGQVPLHLIGKDAFQESDIVGITRPITKHNFMVRDVKELASTVKKAFYIASSGRPGPVLIDIPKNIFASECEFHYPENIKLRGYSPGFEIHNKLIKSAVEAIKKAKKPLLYVGGGVIMSGGSEELKILAKENKIPVTMTLQGLGAFPGNDSQSLGMLGMHGTYYANMAVNECDLLIACGARFDDRVTGDVKTFAKDAFKIAIDIDPTVIDKNVKVDLALIGDVKHILAEIASELNGEINLDEWWNQINHWKEICPIEVDNSDDKLKIPHVIDKINELTKGKAIIVTDVGQHQMWTAQFYKYEYPRTNLTSGGLGTMGFSLPASIGAKIANPDKVVFSVNGDGGFQMNMQELITAVYYKLPIKILILNNNYLGMVRQWQELFHKEKYSFTDLTNSNPDFVKLGEALGIPSFSTDKVDEVEPLLNKALNTNDSPILIEFKVLNEDMVYPMVPSGASISDMITSKFSLKGV